MKHVLLLCILIGFSWCPMHTANKVFNHLSVSDGLSQLSVLSLYQDENDNIWMGTFCGVNIYNGRFFSYILPNGYPLHSIHGNEIVGITGNKQGEVYLRNENGISVVDISDYSVTNIWNTNINCFYRGDSLLWVGVKNELFILNGLELEKYSYQPDTEQDIISIFEHSDKSLWLLTADECIILKTNNTQQRVGIKKGTTFCETSTGCMWIGTADAGAYFVSGQGTILHHLHSRNGLSNNYVRAIVEDEHAHIWIGTFWGLNRYDPIDKENEIFTNSILNNYSISHNSIYSLLIDRQKTLWIGSYYGGISYYNPTSTNFEFYDLLEKNSHKNNRVIAGNLQEDHSGNLWIGTDGVGLKRLERETSFIESFSEQFGGDEGYFNNIKSILVDHNNHLWIGIHLYGLYYYDRNKFVHIPIIIEGQEDLYDANVVNDMVEYENNLLLATLDGVVQYNKDNHKFTYFFNRDLHRKTGAKVYNLYLDSHQRLWIGTKGQGLSMYNLNSQLFNKYQLENSNNYNQISNNHITEVVEDTQGNIWVSTYGGGLNLFNEKENNFTSFRSSDYGFSTDYFQSVKAVNDSLLVIGGKSSVILFNSKQRKLVTEIDYKNGFPLEELLERSVYVTKDAQLYVTGKNGMVHFSSTDLTNYEYKDFNLAFDRLYVNNEEILPGDESRILNKSLRHLSHITLKHNQTSFSFDFAAPNYLKHAQEQYEYRMSDYDAQWRLVHPTEMISYTNVPAGKYTLLLRATSNPGRYTSIGIKVLSPWYLSWWAWLVYASILIVMTGYFIHSRRVKQQLSIAKTEKEHIEFINQQKLVFFTNISHEFNTPLTLILGQIENLLQNIQLPQSAFTKIIRIQKNAFRLKKLISELLEFRKQERGVCKLNVYEMELDTIVKQIYMSFYEYAIHKNITFTLDTEGVGRTIWFDPLQMEKVIYNILFNAFKYTVGGEIAVKVHYTTEQVKISIRDTGKGIKPEDLNSIFDRFYQSAASDGSVNAGVGIGLALVKNILDMHHGTISVSSEYGKGSVFTVSLLYGNSHYNEEEIHHSPWKDPSTVIDPFKEPEELEQEQTQETDYPIECKPQGDTPTILIVEDNEELRNHLISLFESNYTVLMAENGKQGLEIALEKQPDLILSDIMMPEMSGTEMCVKLKTNFETCHIPIILLTAMIAQDHMITGLQNGADDYIGKPFNSRILLLRCANIVNTRRRLQDKYSANPTSTTSLSLASNELDKQFLLKINNYLEEHIEKPSLDVMELAQYMCMSRSAFYNKVKSVTGITPLDIINNYRLKKAVEILSTQPQISIFDLSVEVGFSSPKYFSKSFKAHYGYSPSQYVKKLKEENTKE